MFIALHCTAMHHITSHYIIISYYGILFCIMLLRNSANRTHLLLLIHLRVTMPNISRWDLEEWTN